MLLKNDRNTLPPRFWQKNKRFRHSSEDIRHRPGTYESWLQRKPHAGEFYANSTHDPGATSLPAGGGAETGGWIIDEVPQSEYTSDVKASYAQYNDAAIVLLHHTGAEGNDLHYDMSRNVVNEDGTISTTFTLITTSMGSDGTDMDDAKECEASGELTASF